MDVHQHCTPLEQATAGGLATRPGRRDNVANHSPGWWQAPPAFILAAPNGSDGETMPNNPLSRLFGRSPIKPMQDHMAKVHSCTEQLQDFLQATLDDDWERAAAIQHTIDRLEHEADELKREIRLNLPKSLFLPVPRSDLLELLTRQDKIANVAEDIAGLMLGRRMRIPTPMATPMIEYLECAIAASSQAQVAISELDELLTTGFRGREVLVVEALIRELDRLERRTDELQVDIRAQLFTMEANLAPVDVIFLYRIIDWIGDLADRAQEVGARLLILIAR